MFKRIYLERATRIKTDEINKLESDLRYAKHNNELLVKENNAIREENKDLRFENEELREAINRIERLASSNKYNNERSILNKIKELAKDCK